MTWAPTFQTIDVRPLIDNLIAYITANDADALEWANGGDPGLQEFQELMPSAAGRLNTIYPSLLVIAKGNATDLESDALESGLEFTVELAIAGADPNETVNDATKYAMAVESMLMNMTSAEWTAGAKTATHATLMEYETRYDILRGTTVTATSFLQIVQIRCLLRLMTGGI